MISFECWYNVRYELRKYTERPIYRISRQKHIFQRIISTSIYFKRL